MTNKTNECTANKIPINNFKKGNPIPGNASEPLSNPIVEANYTDKEKNEILVSVSVNVGVSVKSFNVYYGNTIIKDFLPIYIVCDYEDVNTLKICTCSFSFTIPSNTGELLTFLRDIDPRTSRGTETTVQGPLM